MSCRFEHGNISQLLAGLNMPEHEPAAAHVSTTDEFCRKDQPSAEDVKQRVHIFWSCDAAQEYDLAIHARSFGKDSCVAIERCLVALIRGIYAARTNFSQSLQRNNRVRRH